VSLSDDPDFFLHTLPTIIAGGRIAGTWKRTIRKSEVVVSASLFSPLGKTEAHGLSAAVTRYADFHRLPRVLL